MCGAHPLVDTTLISIFLGNTCSRLSKELAPLVWRMDWRIVCISWFDALWRCKLTAFARSVAQILDLIIGACLPIKRIRSTRLPATSIKIADTNVLLVYVGLSLIIRVEKRSHDATKVEVGAILLTEDACSVLLVLLLIHGQVLCHASVLILPRASNTGANQVRRIHELRVVLISTTIVDVLAVGLIVFGLCVCSGLK